MVPTGIHIRDARLQLIDAAERILLSDGPSALTGRALTSEAGVAKGVLHRHFDGFDDFLVEVVDRRAARIDEQARALLASAGTSAVSDTLIDALVELFDRAVVSIIAIVTFQDGLRRRLLDAGASGIPLLSEACAMFAGYLGAERELGRIAADADVDALGIAVVGAGHLLFADTMAGPPSRERVARVVDAIIADVVQRRLL
ncbi:MAG TPA: TetR/AcrR family transcriptional regulator [Microbacteriaceae bacterium]|nr:TetR/AcrR family transcriptional regulator [Microbacteriaceae bacterium]